MCATNVAGKAVKILAAVFSRFIYLHNRIVWRKPARPDKIIWIDPHSITRSIEFSPIVQRRLYYLNGVVTSGAWGYTKRYIMRSHLLLFKAFEDYFISDIPFSDTEYFHERKVSKTVLTKNIEDYENKYDQLYNDIRSNGFRCSNTLYNETDDFKISIAADGSLLFMTGKHRLAIARLMHQNFKIPAKVAFRHREWQLYRDELFRKLSSGEISKKDIIKINHPDLYDLI